MVIYRHKDKYSISEMCRFFGVSRSGYYGYVSRMDQPAWELPLAEKIRECQEKYGKTYGYRRVHIWLERNGIYRNPKTILRVMQKYSLLLVITRTITRLYLHVEYENIYPSEDVVASDLSQQKIRTYIPENIIEEAFVEGAKFLVMTWGLSSEIDYNVSVLKEYVFYIDSENRLTPVFDIPTLEDYKGYTVDEFIEEVKPLFEKG